MLIDDPDLNEISDFSKITHDNNGLFGVPTVFETCVSHVSHGNFALQRGSQESMPRETVARQRERGEREGSVISVTESMSKKSRRNSSGSHSLWTHREFYSDERDLRDHLERRAQQDFLLKIQFRGNYTRLSTTWRSKIWSEEIQNTHHSSHSVSLNLKDGHYWKPNNGQEKLEVAKKLKN